MKITQVETIHLGDFPHILFVAIHTDEGLVGCSDTFYMTDAMRAYIHQFAAPMLLGYMPKFVLGGLLLSRVPLFAWSVAVAGSAS